MQCANTMLIDTDGTTVEAEPTIQTKVLILSRANRPTLKAQSNIKKNEASHKHSCPLAKNGKVINKGKEPKPNCWPVGKQVNPTQK